MPPHPEEARECMAPPMADFGLSIGDANPEPTAPYDDQPASKSASAADLGRPPGLRSPMAPGVEGAVPGPAFVGVLAPFLLPPPMLENPQFAEKIELDSCGSEDVGVCFDR